MTVCAPLAPLAPPAPAQLDGLLAAGAADLSEHLRRHGPVPAVRALIAGLTELGPGYVGRGGAAFPAASKLAAVQAAVRDSGWHAVVVGNGAEGEPASRKDRMLLATAPHLVLDGLQLAAAAAPADEIHLVVTPDPALHARLRGALAERAAAALDPVPVHLHVAGSTFVAGQETAVLRTVTGGPALPTYLPTRIAQRGLHGRPTLLHNVETLAGLALLARRGPHWWRAQAAGPEAGSMLMTIWPVTGGHRVVEIPRGAALRPLLGGHPRGAVLVGGFHGAWLPADVAADLRLLDTDLRPYGAAVGAGIVAELPVERCGLAETARVVAYLAGESAGQCGPCLNGLPRIAGGLIALADRQAGPAVLADLERWSGLVVRRGACAHPDGSVRLVRSALQTFSSEVDAHLHGRCTAADPTPFLPVPGVRP